MVCRNDLQSNQTVGYYRTGCNNNRSLTAGLLSQDGRLSVETDQLREFGAGPLSGSVRLPNQGRNTTLNLGGTAGLALPYPPIRYFDIIRVSRPYGAPIISKPLTKPIL